MTVEVDPEDIYEELPGGNCGACGAGDCWLFALGLAAGRYNPQDCPHLSSALKKRLTEAGERGKPLD